MKDIKLPEHERGTLCEKSPAKTDNIVTYALEGSAVLNCSSAHIQKSI